MRSKRGFLFRRRPGAAAGVILVIGLGVAGCSGTASSSSSAASSSGADAAAAVPAAVASASASAPASSGQPAASDAYVVGSPQLIETAQLTVRAASVNGAVSRATSIVKAVEGYVSAENATSGTGQPGKAAAAVTFKIPVAAYPAVLADLSGSALGTQLSLTQQAQDVTEQVADVSSRVTSDQAAIAQLRALLAKAGSVSALLSVQDQINSEESDLESMLAQQNALGHETSYATLTVTIEGPAAAARAAAKAAQPPGLSGGASRGWHAFRVTLSWLLTVLGAVAPFAAVIAVFGAVVWWGRRVQRQRGRPAGEAD
jgi:hypothetical protein